MNNKTGKVAFVTGGAKRLGKNICLALAAEGYDIAFSYLKSEKESVLTEKGLNSLGIKTFRMRADLTKKKDIQKFFSNAQKKLGKPSVLVNNASIFKRTPYKKLNAEIFEQTIDTNLKSYYLCALEAAKLMKNNGGRIINISSLGGIRPYKHYLPYSVSKAGVIMLTKCLALELAPDILVNSIAPGVLELPEEKKKQHLPPKEKIPLGKYGSPDEITNFILYLINSQYITGQVFLIDGGKVLN